VEITAAQMNNETEIPLELRVLGEFVVLHDGKHVSLPTSRKTRALLAYLAVNGPQQREHLCEIFWDVAQNPRRALRWSLWQIRKLVNIKGYCALVSEGPCIFLRSQFVTVDFLRLKELMRDLASLDTVELEEFVSLFRGKFLEDLSLPRCPDFEGWRISCMNEVHLSKMRTLSCLIDRLDKDQERALPYVHALHAMRREDVT
jgi:DNA-binding SARP family transcriptional activator